MLAAPKCGFACTKCKGEANTTDSQVAGSKTLSSRIHFGCASIAKGISTRMRLDPRFKAWWSEATEEVKTEYFDRQRRRLQPGKGQARIWDDYQITSYEDSKKGNEERIRIHWQPFTEFETEKLMRGMKEADIKIKWQQLIGDAEIGL